MRIKHAYRLVCDSELDINPEWRLSDLLTAFRLSIISHSRMTPSERVAQRPSEGNGRLPKLDHQTAFRLAPQVTLL
jgi:hypothetical protein